MDLQTATAVRQALKTPPIAGASQNVSVTVKKGAVTLRGTVPDPEARTTVLNQIEKLPGVDRVDDRLTVGKE